MALRENSMGGGSLGAKGLGEGHRAVGRLAGYMDVCVFLLEEKVDSRCSRAFRESSWVGS